MTTKISWTTELKLRSALTKTFIYPCLFLPTNRSSIVTAISDTIMDMESGTSVTIVSMSKDCGTVYKDDKLEAAVRWFTEHNNTGSTAHVELTFLVSLKKQSDGTDLEAQFKLNHSNPKRNYHLITVDDDVNTAEYELPKGIKCAKLSAITFDNYKDVLKANENTGVVYLMYSNSTVVRNLYGINLGQTTNVKIIAEDNFNDTITIKSNCGCIQDVKLKGTHKRWLQDTRESAVGQYIQINHHGRNTKDVFTSVKVLNVGIIKG